MGDETTSPTSPTGPPPQTTQSLLEDIFGTSNDELSATTAPAASAPAPKSNFNDILGLFDSATSLSAQPTGGSSLYSSSSPSGDLFSSLSSTPGVTSPPVPQPPQAYDVYNKDGLKITLTPVRDATKPLVVNILAKFTSTQSVSAVNFQAAVPKVPDSLSCFVTLLLCDCPNLNFCGLDSDPETPDARHVSARRRARSD